MLRTRRQFVQTTVATALAARSVMASTKANQAHVAITLDLEMSRNFPRWEDTHWDYEKGNLNQETKQYTLEACRRIKAKGGVAHCFVVGRVLEQENVDWLKELVKAGHRIGNHTYDHVNVKAQKPADLQFRFQRAPWLIAGKQPIDVIRENIRVTSAALKQRLGVDPVGFRTPGGFANGLADRPDVQRLLQELGFTWVSSRYPPHSVSVSEVKAQEEIVKAQVEAQPSVYPTGLIELPMSPVSDITAFRGGRWKLDQFLRAIERAVAWVIAHGAVFDFLGHPSCLYVVDPQFRVVDTICDLVKAAGEKAALADLDTIARASNRFP